jgi:ribosomal protein L7Ae-like RNA K-turn-binding protein
LEKNLNRIGGLVSIARKAGYVVIGKDNLAIYTKKLYLLLVDKTAGSSLSREMKFLSENRNIPILEVENLGTLVGIENCKAIGIKNKAISESIEKCVKGE